MMLAHFIVGLRRGGGPRCVSSAAAICGVALLASGCGAEDPPLVAGARLLDGPSEDSSETDYPDAPFGRVVGAKIDNLQFYGWRKPAAVEYDSTNGEVLSLADYYKPDSPRPELMMVNSVAVWCGACQAEYADLRDRGIAAKYREQGLVMLGVLFEDADGEPARYEDLENWGRAFSVDFPFVLDPGFKTGIYFERAATPMNMLIDLRTMEILSSHMGYNPAFFEDEVEPRLEELAGR